MDLESTIGLDNTDPNSHKKSWAGIQHVLGTSSTNLVEQNVAFIELWINIVIADNWIMILQNSILILVISVKM